MKSDHDLATRCVHAGEVRDAEGSPHTPIYNTTTFGFTSTADLLDVVEGRRPGNLYTRYGLNPTIRSVEVKLATLENAECAETRSSSPACRRARENSYSSAKVTSTVADTLIMPTDRFWSVGSASRPATCTMFCE